MIWSLRTVVNLICVCVLRIDLSADLMRRMRLQRLKANTRSGVNLSNTMITLANTLPRNKSPPL